jgi:hypothetical protein
LDAHGLDVLIGQPGGADAYWVRVTFEPDVRDTGAEVGVGADLVGQRAAVAREASPSTMSVCSGSSSRIAIRSGNRFRIVSTSVRGSWSAPTTQ